ncbi:hypothetical protein [Paenibacillus lautus]|uniref:hypothetical protein n=1 Tax=Paenibacillus lautus TaxID=1401 RepID=UPI003D2679C9
MRSDAVDLTGMSFGRWEVVSYYGKNNHNQNMWMCICRCGTIKAIRGAGKIESKSCGCLQREKAADTFRKVNKSHGDCKTRLHSIWAAMKRRCNNPNTPEFKNYGGRGVKVCSEWNDYSGFKKWAVSSGYSDDLTIERIDVNGDYEPSNCEWVTIQQQQQNRRNNIKVDYNGETMTIAELSRRTGIKDKTLYSRYKKGARTINQLTQGALAGSFLAY